MKKIYATYRPQRIGQPIDMIGVTLNGVYTPSFYLNMQYYDWFVAGYTNVKDIEILEESYTTETAPGIKSLKRFMYVEYDETKTTDAELGDYVTSIGSAFGVDIFETALLAAAWIRSNTNMTESPTGTFLIHPQLGTVSPKYLTID